MRILIVSFFFPPYNGIGALRVGKTAKLLSALGHDIRVLTVQRPPAKVGLPVEIASDRVTAARWIDVNRPGVILAGGEERVAASGYEPPAGRMRGLWRFGADIYRRILNIPDGQIGWYPYAVSAGKKMLEDWRPDVILASSPPPTSILVAARLARRFEVPFVIDFRDLWIDEHRYRLGVLRKRLESGWEGRLVRRSAGLVTVSEGLAEQLWTRYHVPTIVVRNGFDQDDQAVPASIKASSPDTLRIVYTGMLYPQEYDLGVFFDAVAGAIARAPGKLQVEMYGRYLSAAAIEARRAGVESHVTFHPGVSHDESLRLQRNADALLLWLPKNPQSYGSITGKFYEYVAARRPILAVGPAQNEACRFIETKRLGAVAADAASLQERLIAWSGEKLSSGSLPELPPASIEEFARIRQIEALDRFLVTIANKTAGPPP